MSVRLNIRLPARSARESSGLKETHRYERLLSGGRRINETKVTGRRGYSAEVVRTGPGTWDVFLYQPGHKGMGAHHFKSYAKAKADAYRWARFKPYW